MQRLLLAVPLNIVAIAALAAMVAVLVVLFVAGIPGASGHKFGPVLLPIAMVAVSAAIPMFFFIVKHVLAVQSLRHKGAGLLVTAVILGFNFALVTLSLNFASGIPVYIPITTLLLFQSIVSWKIHRTITHSLLHDNTLGVFSKEAISIISLGTTFIGALGLLMGLFSSIELTMISSTVLILGLFGWHMSKNFDEGIKGP